MHKQIVLETDRYALQSLDGTSKPVSDSESLPQHFAKQMAMCPHVLP